MSNTVNPVQQPTMKDLNATFGRVCFTRCIKGTNQQHDYFAETCRDLFELGYLDDTESKFLVAP